MENKNGVFIGARALSESQVKLIVPTYDNIINQIEEIRVQARSIHESKEKNSKRQYNNTIGLFGERGTGKTSTMYTILKQLEDKGAKDIVLPIIEPDIYGDSTKVLGAILGVLKEEMKRIEKVIEDNEISNRQFSSFFNQCKFKESNELSRSYNEILEYYCYKDSEYRKLIMTNYTDMETYKKKYSYILAPDHEFNQKLHLFIDELINVKRKLNKDDEPLIIITIDDIDLKTNKCRELIDAVMAYTCHSNIVCFLSGDYEILSESITLALLETEELAGTNIVTNDDLFDSKYNLMTRKKYLAHEYLKKVLPPAFRHNVVKWHLKSIPMFSFQFDGKDQKIIYLYEKLDDLMGNDNIFNRKGNSESGKGIFTQIPYIIFDRTPRGLINVFYYLSKYEKEEFIDREKRFVYIKSLVDTIIYSSSYLIKYQSKIYDKHLKWGSSEENTVIDFKRLFTKKLLNSFDSNSIDEDKKDKKRKCIEEYIVIFMLLQTIKDLLPKANVVGYEDTKKYFFYLYNYNISENNLNVDVDKVKLSYVSFNKKNNTIINAWIDQIIFNTDFKFALSFLEDMKNNINISLEGAKILSIIERRDIYLILCRLILDNNEGMIKKWYLDRSQYIYIIEFLDLFSRESIENEKVEKILNNYNGSNLKENTKNISYSKYQYILLQKPEKIGMEAPIQFKTENGIYEKYIKQVFYNYIIKEKYEDIDQDREGNYKSSSIIKILKKIDKNGNTKSNNIKINELLKKEVHKKVDTIIDSTANVNISSDDLIKKLNVFYTGRSSGGTVYSKTIEFVKDIINEKEAISICDYIKVILKLRYLAYISPAWYGVSEARKLLEVLTKESYLDINDIEFNSIMREYVKYRSVNSIEMGLMMKLDENKKVMKDILEKAFEEARAEEELFYNDFDLELPDEE